MSSSTEKSNLEKCSALGTALACSTTTPSITASTTATNTAPAIASSHVTHQIAAAVIEAKTLRTPSPTTTTPVRSQPRMMGVQAAVAAQVSPTGPVAALVPATTTAIKRKHVDDEPPTATSPITPSSDGSYYNSLSTTTTAANNNNLNYGYVHPHHHHYQQYHHFYQNGDVTSSEQVGDNDDDLDEDDDRAMLPPRAKAARWEAMTSGTASTGTVNVTSMPQSVSTTATAATTTTTTTSSTSTTTLTTPPTPAVLQYPVADDCIARLQAVAVPGEMWQQHQQQNQRLLAPATTDAAESSPSYPDLYEEGDEYDDDFSDDECMSQQQQQQQSPHHHAHAQQVHPHAAASSSSSGHHDMAMAYGNGGRAGEYQFSGGSYSSSHVQQQSHTAASRGNQYDDFTLPEQAKYPGNNKDLYDPNSRLQHPQHGGVGTSSPSQYQPTQGVPHHTSDYWNYYHNSPVKQPPTPQPHHHHYHHQQQNSHIQPLSHHSSQYQQHPATHAQQLHQHPQQQQTIRCAENGKSYLELGTAIIHTVPAVRANRPPTTPPPNSVVAPSLRAEAPPGGGSRCCDGRTQWCHIPCYRQRRLAVLNLSMCKLARYRQCSDPSLRRSVLICNTLRRLEREMEQDPNISAAAPQHQHHPQPQQQHQHHQQQQPPLVQHQLHHGGTAVGSAGSSDIHAASDSGSYETPSQLGVSSGAGYSDASYLNPSASTGFNQVFRDSDDRSGRLTPFPTHDSDRSSSRADSGLGDDDLNQDSEVIVTAVKGDSGSNRRDARHGEVLLTNGRKRSRCDDHHDRDSCDDSCGESKDDTTNSSSRTYSELKTYQRTPAINWSSVLSLATQTWTADSDVAYTDDFYVESSSGSSSTSSNSYAWPSQSSSAADGGSCSEQDWWRYDYDAASAAAAAATAAQSARDSADTWDGGCGMHVMVGGS